MSVLASTLIAECAIDLLDTSYDRWSQDNWLVFLNAGERQLIYFKPTCYTVTAVYQLAAGTKQNLPDGTATYQNPSSATLKQAVELIDITRNMGADGLTAGASIRRTSLKDLDETLPAWRSATAAATTLNYVFNPEDRTKFEVYPPQPSSSRGWIEAVYSAVPTVIASAATAINLRDEYAEPLKVYMKHRAYAVDAQISQYAYQRAIDHWNQLVTLIGRKDLLETTLPPVRGAHGNTNQRV